MKLEKQRKKVRKYKIVLQCSQTVDKICTEFLFDIPQSW